MARPCKSAKVLTDCSQTKEEIENRIDKENNLRGATDNIKPPSYLNTRQKKIFTYIVQELENANILGNLDIYILTTCVIAIDRLQRIETIINKEPDKLFDKSLMSAKDRYTKDLFRTCNELSLSPQARAKMANINLQTESDNNDPLLKVLRGGNG